jgi:hypothetical protein
MTNFESGFTAGNFAFVIDKPKVSSILRKQGTRFVLSASILLFYFGLFIYDSIIRQILFDGFRIVQVPTVINFANLLLFISAILLFFRNKWTDLFALVLTALSAWRISSDLLHNYTAVNKYNGIVLYCKEKNFECFILFHFPELIVGFILCLVTILYLSLFLWKNSFQNQSLK